MVRIVGLVVLSFALAAAVQQSGQSRKPVPNQPPPRSDQAENQSAGKTSAGASSSKDTPVDLSPPPDDAKTHPDSASAVQEAEDAAGLYSEDEIGGIQEFKPWNPHKAEKDVEVGDFYFKRKNYRAALDRYREALYYKNNDAVATFRMAVCQEKLGDTGEARKGYQDYLKILPQGPFAEEAHRALERLKAGDAGTNPASDKSSAAR
jgi:tetratricopeptide (TPR) repeat protein